jgi:hypothetical protein
MNEIDVKFIDSKTAAGIPGLPNTFDEKHLIVGKKITMHFFIGGWQSYKIKNIEDGNPKQVYVKRIM